MRLAGNEHWENLAAPSSTASATPNGTDRTKTKPYEYTDFDVEYEKRTFRLLNTDSNIILPYKTWI